ncbi:MAG: hypothetical protein AV945_gp47 [Phormidium phage MIS-PhV1B]|jgi:hypothetical protein|nr:MAG: hypothetical protein AV945_gp47 [Phormidium phage MIS-PhV1B]AGZ61854.1 MAG: hypothetical protein [Phormidium phage MIS-PhV1B]
MIVKLVKYYEDYNDPSSDYYEESEEESGEEL